MNGVLLEILTKQTFSDLQKLENSILRNIKFVTQFNNEWKKVNVPSDISKGINQVNEATKKSNKTVSDAAKLQKKLAQSEVNRLNSLTKANKQIIQNRVVTQQANRQTRQMSELNSKLTGEFRKQEIRLNQLRTRYKNVAVSQGESSKEAQKLLKRLTALDARLKKVSANAGQFQKNVGNYPAALGSAARAAMNLARAMGFVGGAFLVAGTIRNVVKVFKDFDQSQADLAAILGKSRTEITALTEQAKELGATTAFTATQVAELQLELSKLGFGEDEILAAARGVENLAIATGVDAARAAKLAGAALRGFNLEAEESNRVAAALAVSTTKSASSFETLEVALPKVSAIANSFGFSIEDTTALLGGLQNAGFEASIAGTSLRQIFLQLADSNGKLAQRLGGGAKNFDELIGQFKKLEEEGISLGEAFNLTNARSVAAFKTFLTGADDLKVLRDSIVDVEDELTELADTKLDSVQGRVTLLNSAWQGWILSLDESGEASKTINNLLDFLTKNLSRILNTIVKVAKGFLVYKGILIATSLATRGYVFATTALRVAKIALAGGIGKATVAMRAFNIATKANPIGLITSVIAGAIGVWVAFKDGVSDSADALKRVREEAEETKRAIVESNIELVKQQLKLLEDQAGTQKKATEEQIKFLQEEIQARASGSKLIEEINEKAAKSDQDRATAAEKAAKDATKSYEDFKFSASQGLGDEREAIDKSNEALRVRNRILQNTSNKAVFQGEKETVDALKKILSNLLEVEKDNNKESVKLSEQQAKKLRKDAFDLAKFRLKTAIDTNKEIRDDEDRTLQDRFEANRQVVNLQKELAVLEKDFAISNAEGRGDAITKSVEESTAKQNKAVKDGLEKRDGIYESFFKKQITRLSDLDRATKLTDDQALNELKAKLIGNNASVEESDRQLTELRRQQQRKQLENSIFYLEKELLAFALTAEQKEQVEIKLAALRSQLLDSYLNENKEVTSKLLEEEQKRKEAIISALDSISEVLGVSSDSLFTLFDGIQNGFKDSAAAAQAFGEVSRAVFAGIMEASNQRLEAELNDLEIRKDTELQFAGDSDAAKKQIEERFDKRQTEIRTKQAQNDKAQALFDIGIATAVATIKALPNIPLSIFIGALGVAQAAVVASRPIPAFAEGVENFSGGTAMINDQKGSNYQELVQTPDGKVRKFRGRNLIMDLPKGTNVLSASDSRGFESDLNNILMENNINGYGDALFKGVSMPNINLSGGVSEEQLERVMLKTLGNQKAFNINIDKNGIQTIASKGHSNTVLRNNRLAIKGRKV